MHKLLKASSGVMALSCIGLSHAADHPEPGLYAMTSKMSSEQLPISRTHNSESCLKDEDFSLGPKSWMKDQPGQECQVINYDVEGGQINMQMRCELEQGGKGEVVGSGSYTNDSFTMTNTMKMTTQGMTMEMITTVEAKRQGPC